MNILELKNRILEYEKNNTRHLLHRRIFNATLQEQLLQGGGGRDRRGRPSPSVSAQDHPGRRRKGQDGRAWRSVPNKNGVHRWVPVRRQSAARARPRRASPARSSAFKPKRVSHVALDWTRPRGPVEVAVAHPSLVEGDLTTPVRRALAPLLRAAHNVDEYDKTITFQLAPSVRRSVPWRSAEELLDKVRRRFPDLRYILSAPDAAGAPPSMRIHINRSGKKTVTKAAKRRKSVLSLLPRRAAV